MSGEVCHFELPAKNMTRAQKFYQKAFGWKTQSMPGWDYTMVQTAAIDKKGLPKEKGVINGGIMKRTSQFQHPNVVVWVESIERAQKKVMKAGGKLVGETMPVGEMGRVAYFKDSEGNLVGLFQPAE